MRAPDGTEHRLSGIYREIVEDELLVFTHAWEDEHGKRGHETVVTVRFADQDGKTKLTFHQASLKRPEGATDMRADGPNASTASPTSRGASGSIPRT